MGIPYNTNLPPDLRETVGDSERIALSEIADKDAIYQSIKDFLGKGR